MAGTCGGRQQQGYWAKQRSWRSSPEHSEWRRRYFWVQMVCWVALLVVAWGCINSISAESAEKLGISVGRRWGWRCAGIGLLVLVIGATYAVATREAARGAYFERQRGEAQEEAALAASRLGEEPTLDELIAFARLEMREHNLQAQEHARTSFVTSQAAAGAGLVWLLVWAVIAVVSKGSGVQVAAGSLATVGGALSAYINRTYVRLHETSLRQQNYYYGQPVMRYLLLQAERLANVPLSTKEELYTEMVRMLIRGAERMLPGQAARGPARAPATQAGAKASQ